MTSEERLKQTEILLQTAAKYINQHSEAIARQDALSIQHSEAIARNDEQIAQLNLRMLELVDMFSELAAITRQNQAEIRRIWEYLLSQSDNGHSS